MTQTIRVLEMILPVALMMGIGMYCGRRAILTQDGIAAVKKVAVDISLSAVVFSAFAAAEYSLRTAVIPAIMFVVCLVAWALGQTAQKRLVGQSRYLPALTTGFEAGMLGYTLYSILYGADVSAFAAVDLGQVLFVFTVYKLLLGHMNPGAPRLNVRRDILSSPIIIAIAAGMLVGATGLYKKLDQWGVAGIVDACTAFVAAPTSALILLSIGYDLVSGQVRWGQAVKAVGVRLVIMAVLGTGTLFLLRGLFGQDVALERAIVLMFLLPPPFVLPIFADDDQERSSIASALSLSTLVTMAAFVVLAAIGA